MKLIFEVPVLLESGAVKATKFVKALTPASAEGFVRALGIEGNVGHAVVADLSMVFGMNFPVLEVICADLPSLDLEHDREHARSISFD